MKFVYPYIRGDGVPVASPLFQGEGGGSIPTSPLQFRLETCTPEDAVLLNKYWHSRLPDIPLVAVRCTSRLICYRSVFDEGIFAAAIWTDPIAANRLTGGSTMMELRRLAIGPEAPKMTATWMISKMVKDIRSRFPDVLKLISYQDTGVHTGTIYKASGWKAVSECDLTDWSNRPGRRQAQAPTPKIRWEIELVKPKTRNGHRSREEWEQEKEDAMILQEQTSNYLQGLGV